MLQYGNSNVLDNGTLPGHTAASHALHSAAHNVKHCFPLLLSRVFWLPSFNPFDGKLVGVSFSEIQPGDSTDTLLWIHCQTAPETLVG